MGFKGEIVEFYTKDGLVLNGFLQKPRNAKLCLIHVHGMNSDFYTKRTLTINKELNKKGIAALSINTRGNGIITRARTRASRKTGSSQMSMAGTSFEKFEDCVYDIGGAINFASKAGFGRVVLSGQSTGCQKIAYYQYKKKDRRVLGLVLLAPTDDYNVNKRDLGRSFNTTVRMCASLVGHGEGNKLIETTLGLFSAKRFLSDADPKNPEARIFNYDGDLREFAAIKVPMCVIFGSREQFAVKPIKDYMKILKRRSRSKMLQEEVIRGADHFFRRHEVDVAKIVSSFISKTSKTR